MGIEAAQQASDHDNGISYEEYASRIGEMHHRIKNHLQLILSLFSLQADRTTDPQVAQALLEMQNRMRAIAYLHEPLYTTDSFSTILVGEYLKIFVPELHASYREVAPHVQLQISVADVALDAADAVPLALICNELVSNAFRHAFRGQRSGNVSIALRYSRTVPGDEPQSCELEVADDGSGLPEGTDVMAAESLGFHIVQIMTRQLRGRLQVRTGDGGASFLLVFPLRQQ